MAAKSVVAARRCPLDKAITATIAFAVGNTSSTFANVRVESRFLFNVPHNRGKSIFVSNACLGLKKCESSVFVIVAIFTDKPRGV